jgi:hypothetical protein
VSERTAGTRPVNPVGGGEAADYSEGVAQAPVKGPGGSAPPSIGLTMLGSADQGATCADDSCAVPEALAWG